jgi:two-component system, NarL family, response regulator DegU
MINGKIKVYLAEDHNVVRKAMQRLLSSFPIVDSVKDAANGKELLQLMENECPDAVIIDVEMPIMGGVEAAKIIANKYPTVKMLILSMHNESVFIKKLMDIGVHGFLTKSAQPDEVEKALKAIVFNDFYRNEISMSASANRNSKIEQEKYHKLTNREIEVLLLICQEMTPGEISERLQISEKTFFNHRANALLKTNSRSNVGLIRYAIKHGIIEVKRS